VEVAGHLESRAPGDFRFQGREVALGGGQVGAGPPACVARRGTR
jgi:hypothetical protein